MDDIYPLVFARCSLRECLKWVCICKRFYSYKYNKSILNEKHLHHFSNIPLSIYENRGISQFSCLISMLSILERKQKIINFINNHKVQLTNIKKMPFCIKGDTQRGITIRRNLDDAINDFLFLYDLLLHTSDNSLELESFVYLSNGKFQCDIFPKTYKNCMIFKIIANFVGPIDPVSYGVLYGFLEHEFPWREFYRKWGFFMGSEFITLQELQSVILSIEDQFYKLNKSRIKRYENIKFLPMRKCKRNKTCSINF